LEFQFNNERLQALVASIDELKAESSKVSQKSKDLLNNKIKIEKQLSAEAHSMGSLIEEKQKRLEEIKAKRDALQLKIKRLNT
jgi:predicted  nucleic acid-binding Zn-ribbon protein